MLTVEIGRRTANEALLQFLDNLLQVRRFARPNARWRSLGPPAEECKLLLVDEARTADLLYVEINVYLDAVGDLYERNAAIHAIVLAIKGHRALD
jgi:hypothetical protein